MIQRTLIRDTRSAFLCLARALIPKAGMLIE